MYTVYCHTNKKNGKRYVGVTQQKPEKRWNNGEGYRHSTYFYNAIKKYGWDAFDHTILFSGMSKEAAEKTEKELIFSWSLQNPKHGYNIDGGGQLNKKLSEHTKRKISNANKGRQMTREQVEKMAKHKRGVVLSAEHKRKIARGCSLYNIKQYNKQGELLRVFESMSEAIEVSGISRATLYEHLTRPPKTTKSEFLWKRELKNETKSIA
jgi:group I intron endonuclease